LWYVKCCLASCLLLSACYAQPRPEFEASQLGPVNTLVLHYETSAQRRDFQAWLQHMQIPYRASHGGGGRAEYLLEQALSAEQESALNSHWQTHYRLERHEQRLLLLCCAP